MASLLRVPVPGTGLYPDIPAGTMPARRADGQLAGLSVHETRGRRGDSRVLRAYHQLLVPYHVEDAASEYARPNDDNANVQHGRGGRPILPGTADHGAGMRQPSSLRVGGRRIADGR